MGEVDTVAREPSALLGRRLDRILDRLERHRVTERLLDVGCGRGMFALAARARGWDVYATEISASCVRKLRPLLGDRIYEGAVVDAAFPRGSFDAVVLIEVIEHVDDPATYASEALRLLRPGGCLFLTTPNFEGLSARIRGTSWRVVADEHLTYFDVRTIRKLLESAGFARVKVRTTGLDIPWLVEGIRALGTTSTQGPQVRSGGSGPWIGPTDLAVELMNGILAATRLGDGLRVWAERPT